MLLSNFASFWTKGEKREYKKEPNGALEIVNESVHPTNF